MNDCWPSSRRCNCNRKSYKGSREIARESKSIQWWILIFKIYRRQVVDLIWLPRRQPTAACDSVWWEKGQFNLFIIQIWFLFNSTDIISPLPLSICIIWNLLLFVSSDLLFVLCAQWKLTLIDFIIVWLSRGARPSRYKISPAQVQLDGVEEDDEDKQHWQKVTNNTRDTFGYLRPLLKRLIFGTHR